MSADLKMCKKKWNVAQNVSPNKHILAIKCVVTVGTFIFPDSRDPFCNCRRHIETFQITQIKEKLFSTKLETSNVLYWTCYSRNCFWIEWFQWRRECIDHRINNRIHYNHRKVNSSIVLNPFKQITTFFKSQILPL